MCSSKLGKKSKKRKKEKIIQLNVIFYPFAPPALVGRFVPFLIVESHRRRNHPSQILSRLIQEFGATGTQNLGFLIDFDSSFYNSVTHYRATL